MIGGLNIGGKRELLASGLRWSGASYLLSQLPARDSLLVLNYHRVGNAEDDIFDPGVFSASADQFDDHISYLKRHVSLVTLQEALSFAGGTFKERTRRCRTLITFDDGYLDNYEIAFPILRSHGVQGVFFLATSMVGSSHVPWWDRIAYLMKTARRRKFLLRYPVSLNVDIDADGFSDSLTSVLRLYKKPENSDPSRFIRELEGETNAEDVPEPLRRFLSWDEARQMILGGMAIGSHTRSHHVLSQLEPEQQRQELIESRAILRKELGIEAETISYPVGSRNSFTSTTQDLAQQAGYRAAFSFYGGTNMPGRISPYDLKRVSVGDQSWSRFMVQANICRVSGSYWP